MKFATDRHRPPGDWVQATGVEKVAGIQYRKGACKSWSRHIAKSQRAGMAYGVELAPEPANPADRNAIAVYGFAETPGLFHKRVRKRLHVGYLPRETAADIQRDLISQGLPIAGELYSIYWGRGDYFDVNVIVLAPPGHGRSTRERREADNA